MRGSYEVQKIETIQLGQANVSDHRIHEQRLRDIQRNIGIRGENILIKLVYQRSLQGVKDFFFIVDKRYGLLPIEYPPMLNFTP